MSAAVLGRLQPQYRQTTKKAISEFEHHGGRHRARVGGGAGLPNSRNIRITISTPPNSSQLTRGRCQIWPCTTRRCGE